MKKIINVLAIALTVITFSCSSNAQNNEKGTYENLNVIEFSKKSSENKGIILDVRTPGEVKNGVIENAINIDYYSSNFEEEVKKLDRNTPVYVYCKSGGRSGQAFSLLKELGFTQVYNLNGGITAWINNGNNVVPLK